MAKPVLSLSKEGPRAARGDFCTTTEGLSDFHRHRVLKLGLNVEHTKIWLVTKGKGKSWVVQASLSTPGQARRPGSLGQVDQRTREPNSWRGLHIVAQALELQRTHLQQLLKTLGAD